MSFISNSCKILFVRADQLLIPCKYQVINIQYQYKKLSIYQNVIEIGICFTFGESQSTKICIDSIVPCSGRLFETRKGSLESTHMCLPIICLKSLWFLYVNLFLNNTIEKDGLHIHLMDLPPHLHSQC